jgi:CRISPR-associated endonuclease/helicase Cas3
MKALSADRFGDFFSAIWPGRKPFPWQSMLAERVVRDRWPSAIELPTASGKTACLDAAIFALACQANRPLNERTAPRRIWFVVDRRIVVDEAFARAKLLAEQLTKQPGGIVAEVANRLRELSGTNQPLAVARLRGGTWRDDGWAHVPSQPAIICSTVDQLGSSLLFRSYGHGDLTASIWAALAANDSLILLDEAHYARPFHQTLQAICRFRGDSTGSKEWAQEPVLTPFHFTFLSATLPPGLEIDPEQRFPKDEAERQRALDHDKLRMRFRVPKLTALVVVKAKSSWNQFVVEASHHAREFIWAAGKRRVAVMVNRVATATEIAAEIRKQLQEKADVVLLTGRMRPLDRDDIIRCWEKYLRASNADQNDKPIILVTTQCLEVGADFSFDALVTECASLDALRQRFGRLNRLGESPDSPAIILIRERNTKAPTEKESDPVYGQAIFKTWRWLTEQVEANSNERIDFAVETMDSLVRSLRDTDEPRFSQQLAPTDDAPVLLAAHLDLLCQTAPRPVPEPDVALFLHGKEPRQPEVRVVLRADLPERQVGIQSDLWQDIISITPPVSPEMLTVSLYRLRRWLGEKPLERDNSTDVQGERIPPQSDEDQPQQASRDFLLWRGCENSMVTRELECIRPNDVVVLRADERGLEGLGQVLPDAQGFGV